MVKLVKMTGGVLLACSMSQFPEYSQQYVQRLGGAVDELTTVVQDFDQSAQVTGQDREDALLSMQGTEFLSRRQDDMRRTITRQEELTENYAALQDASAFERLLSISKFTDTGITERTWDDFQPAIPLTVDGLIFTVVGYLAGYAAVGGVTGLRRRKRRRRLI
jgi:hypothetical protein